MAISWKVWQALGEDQRREIIEAYRDRELLRWPGFEVMLRKPSTSGKSEASLDLRVVGFVPVPARPPQAPTAA